MKLGITKKLLFFAILIPAIVVAVWLVSNKRQLVKKGKNELEQPVSVLKVKKMTVIPRLLGYGDVQPGKVWKAVAEVSGKIIWKDSRLNSGEFYQKGDLLLKIDDAPYKLKIKQAQADVGKSQSLLKELECNRQNLNVTLGLREKMLKVKSQELERKRKLFKANAMSKSSLEQQEVTILIEQNELQSIRSQLALIPSQLEYEKSQLASSQAKLEQAVLDLKYTQIKAPFAMRISKIDAEVSQYAQVGSVLLEADWTGRSEVVAELDVSRMRNLVSHSPLAENISQGRVRIPESMGLTALVKFGPHTWKARCDRMNSEVDATTRTIGLVVAVDDSYKLSRIMKSPPLVKGMFCTVEVYGRPQTDCIVVPRFALHDNIVYVVNSENRLTFRKVKVKFQMLNFAIIESGLEPGETIVVSDIVPAVSGMKLHLKYDRDFYTLAKKEIGFLSLPAKMTYKLAQREIK